MQTKQNLGWCCDGSANSVNARASIALFLILQLILLVSVSRYQLYTVRISKTLITAFTIHKDNYT